MKANAICHGFARLSRRLAVTEGERKYTYDYHPDGRLARADYGGGRTKDFEWDGLALVRRGGERFVNETHPGGGNPVISSKGVAYLNDPLGTTVGAKRGARYSAAALTAFGEGGGRHAFFTGKPLVEGLGRAFLMRNYRADLAKWQTADPLGYPDGWNPLAYCGNRVTDAVDLLGCLEEHDVSFGWHWRWVGDVAIANGTPLDLPLTIPTVSTSVFDNLLTILNQYLQGAIVDLKPLWEAFQIARDEQGCGAIDGIESGAQEAAKEKASEWFTNVVSIEIANLEFLRIVDVEVDNSDKVIWYRRMKVLYLIHMKVITE